MKDVGPESCGQPTPCWPSPALESVLGKASQHLGLESGQPLYLLELNWGGTECVLSSTGRTAACFLPTSLLPTSPAAWLGPEALCLPGRPGTTGLRDTGGPLLLPPPTLLQDTTRWCWMLVLWPAKVHGDSAHGILRDQAAGIGKEFHPDHCPSQVPRRPHHTPFRSQGSSKPRARILCCCLVESLPPCVGSVGQAECIGDRAVSMGLGVCELRPRCAVWRGVLSGKRCGFKVCVCRGWVG
ncbi:PGAP3 isoform 11 [Pan troglodytes]|uniref:PGAP3 isoform 11 n=1 Tax=Pan troglodytes TaxID=9598 RepID=A0A2J8KH06_PANTR|nr:uncharacterized protein LOC129135264 [Pan troglodytes]PNI34301.1 PGAP3 isoform 11 [Pan troglodytes]